MDDGDWEDNPTRQCAGPLREAHRLPDFARISIRKAVGWQLIEYSVRHLRRPSKKKPSCVRKSYKFFCLGDFELTLNNRKSRLCTLNFLLNYSALAPKLQMIPLIALEPNFSTNDYLRDISVMEAVGYDIGPYTWAIKTTQRATGSNMCSN